jgi:hypothetical protein
MRSELAVEFGEKRNANGEAKLGTFRNERGIFRRRGAPCARAWPGRTTG